MFAKSPQKYKSKMIRQEAKKFPPQTEMGNVILFHLDRNVDEK